jgi:predicted transcriptional regulator of viral defense system
MDVQVTGPERTLVDVLDRPHLSGGWEEIWTSLESVPFFDLDLVVEHVGLLANGTAAAKVGHFLEQHRESLMVEETHLEALQRLSPKKPQYADRNRGAGVLVQRWNLVMPMSVVERRWEELA